MEKLKPCPFCGGEASLEQTAYGTTALNSVKLSFAIRCKKCGASAPNANGYVSINLFPSMDEPIKEEFEAVDDKCIDLVRCKDCKWACLAPQRQTATCMKNRLPFTNDYEYFCADGERGNDGKEEC